jgi:segregation and condensation protein A
MNEPAPSLNLPAEPAPGARLMPSVVDGVALAKLYGEPLFSIPEDLYIPPDALEIFLEAFEGPLDLLLYLIRRQNFNVMDIPLALLTEQYLAYVEQIRTRNLELAAEYLLMAALLIEIKSRMLLPVRKADTGEEVEDPRAELMRRLVEYERIKLAAMQIDQRPRLGRDFARAAVVVEQTVVRRLPAVMPADLRQAWSELLRRARLHAHHHIGREELSVREHMSLILKHLQGRRFAEFGDLFDPAQGVAVLIVHFLALLELARESLVEVTQAAPYAPLYVRLAYVPS